MSAEPAMEMCEQQWRNQVFEVVGTFDRHFLAICSDEIVSKQTRFARRVLTYQW
jgi:hypothetical protein